MSDKCNTCGGETDRNWETPGSSDELEKTKMHRDYVRADRNGWRELYFKTLDEQRWWVLATIGLVIVDIIVGIIYVVSRFKS